MTDADTLARHADRQLCVCRSREDRSLNIAEPELSGELVRCLKEAEALYALPQHQRRCKTPPVQQRESIDPRLKPHCADLVPCDHPHSPPSRSKPNLGCSHDQSGPEKLETQRDDEQARQHGQKDDHTAMDRGTRILLRQGWPSDPTTTKVERAVEARSSCPQRQRNAEEAQRRSHVGGDRWLDRYLRHSCMMPGITPNRQRT